MPIQTGIFRLARRDGVGGTMAALNVRARALANGFRGIAVLVAGLLLAQPVGAVTSTVGTAAGAAAVDGGAATYTVPIVVPPGRAGMQPSLSLSYSSRGGDGSVGLGWSLSGLSSIHRCPQTVEQEGKTLGVSYTKNDRLCLDGQRLVLSSGTGYGESGAEYRTEIDSHARIKQLGGDIQAGTTCFLVEEKSGRVLHYGAVVNSSLGCTSSTTARVTAVGVSQPLSWMVAKVEDRAGNNQTYTYYNNSGEVLLTGIVYTGQGSVLGDRSVALTYADRTSVVAGSEIGTSYLAGGLSKQTKVLQQITTSAGGQTARTYLMTYSKSAGTNRLLLSGIKECGSDGVCHPSTTFAFNSAAQTAQLTSLQSLGLPDGSSGTVPLPQNETRVSIVGDLDGDGAREVAVSFEDTQVHTYLVQMTSDRQIRGAVDLTDTEFTTSATQVADVDGDGRADLIEKPSPTDSQNLFFGIWNGERGQPLSELVTPGATPDANAQALFTRIQSNIPFTSDVDFPVYTADVDGDGRLDIVLMKRDSSCDPSGHPGTCRKVYAYLNQATGSFANMRASAPFSAAKYLFTLQPISSGAGYSLAQIDHIADFNGDGLPDFFLVYAGAGSGYETGNFAGIEVTQLSGTTLSTQHLSPLDCTSGVNNECNWNQGAVAHWLDVNGDGLEDFVIAKPDRPTWYVRLNQGNGTLATTVNTGSSDGLQKFTTSSGERFRYAGRMPSMDVDGDGKPDLLIPSVASGFAARMCTIVSVLPITNPQNGQPTCPSEGFHGTAADTSGRSVAGACPVWSCPEDLATGTVHLPQLPGWTAGEPYRWEWNGLPALASYASGDGADNSAYHLARLKFKQTGTSISVEVAETPLVTSLMSSTSFRADDLFGDGLNDLATTIGCTKGNNTFSHPTAPVGSTNNCIAVDSGGYGPAKVYDGADSTPGTTVAYLATHATLFANINEGVPSSGKLTESVPDMTAISVVPPPLLPDLMASATNGVGDKAVWDYAPLAHPLTQYGLPLYTIDDTYADRHHYFFTSSMPVVTRLRQSNGLGGYDGARSAVYGYDKAIYNHLGRGFQGFRAITSTTYVSDASRRVDTTTTYKQKFPLAGKVEKVERSVASSGRVFERETDIWICGLIPRTACPEGNSLPANTATTPFAPVLDTQVIDRMDLTGPTCDALLPNDGACLSQTKTENMDSLNSANSGWDANGNLRHQVVTSADKTSTGKFIIEHKVESTNNYATPSSTNWPNVTSWWLDKLGSSKTKASISYNTSTHALPGGATAPDRSATTSFVWNDDRTPASKTIAGDTAPIQSLTTAYDYTNTTAAGLPRIVTVSGDGFTARLTQFDYTKNGTGVAATIDKDGYFVLNTKNALNQTTVTEHSLVNGQVTTATDPNGLKTISTYDGFDRLSKVEYKNTTGGVLLPTANITYASCNGATSNACSGVGEGLYEGGSAWRAMRIQTGNPTTVDWFDILGRGIKKAESGFDGTFVDTTTEYDELGTVAQGSAPFVEGDTAYLTGFSYDVLGRPLSKHENRKAPNADVVTTYVYLGNKTSITVSGGSCSTPSTANLCMSMNRYHDVLGRLEQTTQDLTGTPGYATTNYWYDGAGNPVAAKDAEGTITTAQYNDLGRRKTSIDPDARTSTYLYDGLGQLTDKTDARGVTSHFVYDLLGRLSTRTSTNSGSTDASLKVLRDTWAYDPSGTDGGIGLLDYTQREKGPTTSSMTVIWKETDRYEATTKRLQTITSKLDGQSDWSTTFTYDSNGQEATVAYPSGLVVDKGYASNGDLRRLGNSTTGGEYWTADAKDEWGNLSGETYGGSLTGSHVSDPSTGQVTQKVWSSTAGLLDQWDYSYDSLGNLKAQVRTGTVDGSETYNYDNLQRLKQATRSGVPGNPPAVNYSYKASGSLDTKSDFTRSTSGAYVSGTYAYGGAGSGCGPHAVSQVTPSDGSAAKTYQCDASGNVVGGNTLSASYDFNNQPWQVSRAGAGLAQFSYTANGDVFEEQASSHTTWFGPRGYEVSVSSGDNVQRHELGPVIVLREGGADTVRNVLRDRLGSQVMLAMAATGSSGLGAPVISLNPVVSLNGSYQVNWTMVAGATGYVLKEQREGEAEVVVYSGPQTTWSPPSAKPVGNYIYRVQACSPCGAFSNPIKEIVTPGAPVLSVSPNPSPDGNYTVSWPTVTGAQSYALEEKPPNGDWSSISTGSLALSWSPLAAKAPGAYSYRVHACTLACGNYSNTSIENVQGSGLPPPDPISVSPTTSVDGAYTVTWTAVATATSYVLEELEPGGIWTVVPNVSGTSKSFVNRSTGDYSYHAFACKASGCSVQSQNVTVHVNLVGPPHTPTNLVATPNSSPDGNYAVSWDAVTDTGVTYQLEETIAPDTWRIVANQVGRTWSPPTPKADGTYSYRVEACKSGLCSPPSVRYPEVVKHVPVTPGPISISPSPSTGHYTVTWGSVAGSLSYWLEEKVNTGAWHHIEALITDATYSTDQGNGDYTYQVKACALISGQFRCGAFTDPLAPAAKVTVTGAVRPPMPESISGPSACASNNCTYTISWGASTGAQTYELHETTDVTNVDRILTYTGTSTLPALTRSAGGGFAQVLYSYEVRACVGTACSPWRGHVDVMVGPRDRSTDPPTIRAYDAFGQVREGDFSDHLGGTLDTLPDTLHGFTDHNHVDDVRLIHMGGRMYDYQLGRFLNVDPVIQFPSNSQSLNPYSYILNNPLAGRDPSGYQSCDAEGCDRKPENEKPDEERNRHDGFRTIYRAGNGHANQSVQVAPLAAEAGTGSGNSGNENSPARPTSATGTSELRTDLQPTIKVVPDSDWIPSHYLDNELVYAAEVRQYLSDLDAWSGRFATAQSNNTAWELTKLAIIHPAINAVGGMVVGKVLGSAFAMVRGASTIGGAGAPHVVLGLRAGLEETAARVGGETLLNNPAWRQALADIIANPASRITVSVEGLSGSSVYAKVMAAITRPGASATNWELAQIGQAGRLGEVNFVDRVGNALVNPFGH